MCERSESELLRNPSCAPVEKLKREEFPMDNLLTGNSPIAQVGVMLPLMHLKDRDALSMHPEMLLVSFLNYSSAPLAEILLWFDRR
jgi:hypothetical protein